jgi:hypothetical protein
MWGVEHSDPNNGELGSRILLPDALRDFVRSRSGWFDAKNGDFPFIGLGASTSELGCKTGGFELEL